MTARILTCTTAQYHADHESLGPPALHNSYAKVIVQSSPMHAWYLHPRLGGAAHEATAAMDAGSLMHALVLNQPMDEFLAEYEIIDVPDFKKLDARALRDAAIAAGKKPVKKDAFAAALAEARTAAQAIVIRLAALDEPIVFDGESEVKVEWEESLTDPVNEILCRGMLDHVRFHAKGATIYDLKKCESAADESCRKAIANYGYDIQGAAYTSALGKLHPELLGRIDFVDVFVEIEPPYGVNPIAFGGATRHRGEVLWAKACREWALAMKTGKWRGYSSGRKELDVAPWALSQAEEL